MTDEEKAVDRYCKTCKKKNKCFHNCDMFIEYTKGLAEGRKEKETDIFNRWCREEGNECQFLEKLEKENEELKEKLKNEIAFNEQSETVKKYQEQIKELKAHCKAVDDVNEKMKCGGNCRHGYYVNTGGCYDMKCRLTYCDCINCNDKWELAT